MGLTYLVPRDTARLLRDYADQCQNMSLTMGRFVPAEVINNEKLPNNHEQWRSKWMREVCERYDIAARDTDWQVLWRAKLARWDAATASTQRFELRAAGRLLVGLGANSVLETGLTLQAPGGLPFIPGSALKGLARTYALLTIAARLAQPIKDTALLALDDLFALPDDERAKALQAYNQAAKTPLAPDSVATDEDIAAFRAVFGSTSVAGACRFHDAVLSGLPPGEYATLFEVDVMTPHFRKYYESEGDRPPSDDDNPNPILFLTVAAGCRFGFAVAPRPGAPDSQALTEIATRWLFEALQEMGIGGKTAAGYGVFEPVNR